MGEAGAGGTRHDSTSPPTSLQGDKDIVTSQPSGTARRLLSVPSPPACPERRQKPAGKDAQSLWSGGSMALSSTMCRLGLRRLLPLSALLLLLVVQCREPPSPAAAGDTGSWAALGQAPDEQELAPLRDAMLLVEALPWLCAAGALLVKGLGLGWALGRGLWRRWAGEKSQSASASARPRCRGHGCSQELLQLLLENRALMRRCLRHSSRHSPVPAGRRRRSPGTHRRRRVHFSALL
ncbi:PREDICTED: uncharacterized protein LOC101811012 [Ficedula albicollis]|uniref:uncharacterized protein LOC101811012 n=1 Tax=Ficedula albicollis TaxID=59894 RepID=UPI00035991AE|nr:PREDICTED: uncharacterized protein LOC101811012 [Ficedula albicollis]